MPFLLGDALFAAAIAETHGRLARPIRVGLVGSQGSGKSTTAARLVGLLNDRGLRAITCSLDDFYLGRSERVALADEVHPLLVTRGVPGTHDVALMADTLERLADAQRVAMPAFDKTTDDRVPELRWAVHHGPVDVVLLEGWCVGVRAQDEAALVTPINALERDEDSSGDWRRFVNRAITDSYTPLFNRLDLRLMLRAPSFGCVLGWRSEQEAGLPRIATDARRPMTHLQLTRFIAHYERLTRWLLDDEPADIIADLDADRRPLRWRRHAEWKPASKAMAS